MRKLTSAELQAVSGGQTMKEYGLLVFVVRNEHATNAIVTNFPTEQAGHLPTSPGR